MRVKRRVGDAFDALGELAKLVEADPEYRVAREDGARGLPCIHARLRDGDQVGAEAEIVSHVFSSKADRDQRNGCLAPYCSAILCAIAGNRLAEPAEAGGSCCIANLPGQSGQDRDGVTGHAHVGRRGRRRRRGTTSPLNGL